MEGRARPPPGDWGWGRRENGRLEEESEEGRRETGGRKWGGKTFGQSNSSPAINDVCVNGARSFSHLISGAKK